MTQYVLEPLSLRDPEWGRIAELVSKNYENSCIVRIETVKSTNEAEFQARLNELNLTVEDTREMFHGTKEKYVKNILSEGLRGSMNVTSAYGKGTYFSPDIKLSLLSYTDTSRSSKLSFVFLCNVIEQDAGGNGSNIYVCPRDDSFVIRYLIRFYKDVS